MQEDHSLEDRNIICDVCDGSRIVANYIQGFTYCKKCRGVGVVNWLENIFGRQVKLNYDELRIIVKNMDLYIEENKI